MRPLSSSTTCTSRGPSSVCEPVHIDVYGFIRSAVDDRGNNCRNVPRSAKLGQQFLYAHKGNQGLWERQAHPPVALALHDHERPRLGDGEVGTGDPDLGPQELLAQVQAGGLGQPGRVVGQAFGCRPAGLRHLADEDVPDLAPVAVDGGHEEVTGDVAAELDDQLGEVGLPRRDPLLGKGFVESGLLGRHRLDLDDLVGAGGPGELGR